MIAVCPNPFRDIGLELTRKTLKIIDEKGEKGVICPIFAEISKELIPKNVYVTNLKECAAEIDFVVVIGGDGTILEVVRELGANDVPIIGVNLGTKGFMASVEPENIDLISNALKGEYSVSMRMKLDVFLDRNSELKFKGACLNDAVIHGYGDCIRLTAFCDEEKITTFSGDGIILSTPTGSTGYSMSAGGPIVEPEAENIIVSPVCAHALGSRSFVLSPNRAISVIAEKLHDRHAYLSVDGKSVCDIENGDVLRVKKSNLYTSMVSLGAKNFFDTAYVKL